MTDWQIALFAFILGALCGAVLDSSWNAGAVDDDDLDVPPGGTH